MNEISHSNVRRTSALLAIAVTALAMVYSQAAAQDGERIAADLYQFPPASPAELMKAARITQQLDRTGDARAFLRQLLELKLTDDELQALREELGPAPFLDLRKDARLRPESEQLLKIVNAASLSQTRSAQELQDEVKKLATPGSPGARVVTDIVASGEDAIPALLAVDVQTPSGTIANQILVRYARPLRAGLLKQLDGADPAVQVRVLRLLSNTADSQLALRLLRWQFDPAVDSAVSESARVAIEMLSGAESEAATGREAAEILLRKAEAELKEAGTRFSFLNEPPLIRDLTGRNLRAAAVKNAAGLLADAAIVDPPNQRVKIVALVAQCAALDPSLNAEASVVAGRPAEELIVGLKAALELNPEAAIEFLRALQSVLPNETDFIEAGMVLREAIMNPDARVRFLAASIADSLHGEVSASAVSQSLISAKHGSLKPEVVIVSPYDNQLRNLQLVFQDAGFTPAIANTGPIGFEMAAAQMNCELFVLNAESPRWPIAATLANLRADVRTRNTPVVVIGDERFRERVLALAEIHQGVWFMPEPAGTNSLLSKLAQINMPPILLTAEDRAAMKKLAE